MEIINFTRKQACRFLFRKQGFSGAYRFEGKQGIMEYIRQAGCIQFDPVDVCGKNAELVLQSRIKGFTKEMLTDLLYQDRVLDEDVYMHKSNGVRRIFSGKQTDESWSSDPNSGKDNSVE